MVADRVAIGELHRRAHRHDDNPGYKLFRRLGQLYALSGFGRTACLAGFKKGYRIGQWFA